MSVDNWRPAATFAVINARAAMLARIRAFFTMAGVLEVETPSCSTYGATDPTLESLTTGFRGPGYPDELRLFLHTSPEFFMKRLVAAGSGPIYQVCRVYRNGELGRLHNPEFSLLEWYRPGWNYQQLQGEVAALVAAVSGVVLPQQQISYAALFQHHLGIDPHSSDIDTLKACAVNRQIPGALTLNLDHTAAWLDLLLTHCIEPQLPKNSLVFIYDYPPNQAALARIRPDSPPVAERFELYLGGVEVANGFQELTDADEQQQRFVAELHYRKTRGLPAVPMDEYLLAALGQGMPMCAGVALGLDRLLMWLNRVEHIEQVLAFPIARC